VGGEVSDNDLARQGRLRFHENRGALEAAHSPHDGDVSTLIANAHELGRGHGYQAGLAEGYEIAREHMIDRIALQLQQRSGSPNDVGGPVLREAIRRMRASRKDIDPTHH